MVTRILYTRPVLDAANLLALPYSIPQNKTAAGAAAAGCPQTALK